MILAALLALMVDPSAPAAITFATNPCYGNCPVYSVRVTAEGSGLFGARAGSARRFTITAEQYRAFAAHVAPLAGVSTCGHFLDHSQPIDIIWVGADGSSVQRRFYQRCLDRNFPALAPLLRDAPAMLPIRELIPARP